MGVAVDLRVIEGGLSEQRGALRPKRLHAGDSAHRAGSSKMGSWALNAGASPKRGTAKAVMLETLSEVAAAHGLSDGDLAAMFDQSRTKVSQQLRGERAFPVEQLLCFPEAALRDVAGRLLDARAEFLKRWKDQRDR